MPTSENHFQHLNKLFESQSVKGKHTQAYWEVVLWLRVFLYLTLTERQQGGDVVELPSPDHRLHVEDLGADALHVHREEVRVAEVERALSK